MRQWGRRWRWAHPSAIRRCRTNFLRSTASPCDNNGRNNDYEQQSDQQEHYDNRADNPPGKTRFLFAFGLCLLTALNQPVNFGMLWEHSLDFFKLGNRRGVVLIPVIAQTFTIQRVRWAFNVGSARTLHVLHHRV